MNMLIISGIKIYRKLPSSLTSQTKRSRESTWDAEQPPKMPSVAKLAPVMQDLEARNEKLGITFLELKVDPAELKDDVHDLLHGLCAKMRRLFLATGHADLYDAM
jgi:hypothetical protein